jgi:ATP-dependent helicase/DNAse subunit B
VAGLQEGEFPRRARPEPLLGEEERRRIAEASGLLLADAQDVLAAERYLLYAVLSRPEELLFLSWHDADDDGEPVSRSLFVDDVCDLFTDDLERDAQRLAREEPSAVPVTARADTPAAEQGLTHELLLEDLRARMWSASSLEKWVSCPVKWFVEQLLAPRAFEPDAEPLARGGLAHAALADTLTALREETGSARVTPAVLARALELLDEALERGEPDHPLSVSVERRVAVRRRLRADLARYLEYASQLESALEPRHLELGFGFSGEDDHGEESELPAFDLGGGVLMRGRVDRVDVSPSGEAVVIDYKSSFAPKGADWLSDGHLQMGLYMRAVEGLLKLPVAAGVYQPLSGATLRPRGVVSRAAECEVDATRTDLREPDEIAETLDGVLAAALRAAGEARGGRLEPRPGTCGFRGSGCAYPTICRCE